MLKITITSAAENDLISVWRYSEARWSVNQAYDYLEFLKEGILFLSRFPEIGKNYDFIKPEYRMYKIKSHLIFYKIHESELEIIRVIYEKMNVDEYI